MTFDDDYVQLLDANGKVIGQVLCKKINMEWPPPPVIVVTGGGPGSPYPVPTTEFQRIRYSQLTDEERKAMSHVCRGAEYRPRLSTDPDDTVVLH